MVISDIYKTPNTSVTTVGGKIEAGVVSVGDKLVLMPPAEIVIVKSIKVHPDFCEVAIGGENVDLGLQLQDESILLA